jgi:hypothetical protein
MGWNSYDWFDLSQDTDSFLALSKTVISKRQKFLDRLKKTTLSFSRETLLLRVM